MSILMITTALFSSMANINSFESDFKQTITDDKNKSLSYIGHVSAIKPQTALWKYDKPVNKSVFINRYEVTVVEPEIEQVIIKDIVSNFSFFNMIKNAKKIGKNKYEAVYQSSKFIIEQENNVIESISYIDEFENNVIITFTNQKINQKIDIRVFIPKYSLDFDIIKN